LDEVRDEQETIRDYVEDLKEIDATLDPKRGSCARRKKKWLMERKWWSDHRNPLAARVPETAAVERQDPVRGGLRS